MNNLDATMFMVSQSRKKNGKSLILEKDENEEGLVENIQKSIIGLGQVFLTPFGRKNLLYCDHTASGQGLSFIEEFIHDSVLPLYGNTHTTTSVTALQTTVLRQDAREIIRTSCNASSKEDAVIFTGSGCTGAVHKLIGVLELKSPIIFVGAREHHSNLLPWREIGAKVVNIRLNARGLTDLDHLEDELKNHQDDKDDSLVMAGCFSIASNVTGVLEDDLAVTSLLHKYGALSFWDYAAAAPYININMNPSLPNDPDSRLFYKDAIYFSMHKFLGGPQTPGILIAKKYLFQNSVPDRVGGGTVAYVTDTDHRYHEDPEVREEGGTPAIIESIRAGMVFKLKMTVGVDFIMNKEEILREKFMTKFQSNRNMQILGPSFSCQLPIFSLLILHQESGLYLHYNYVVALLNDLFGIQTRGGCACAGPYMAGLLGLDRQTIRKYEEILETSRYEVIKPGATRLNMPWFSTEDEVDFIMSALDLVTTDGWRLLPLYTFNPSTGEWRHVNSRGANDRIRLHHATFLPHNNLKETPKKDVIRMNYHQTLDHAKDIMKHATKLALNIENGEDFEFPPDIEDLRWFLTPAEARIILMEDKKIKAKPQLFTPLTTLSSTKMSSPGSTSTTLNISSVSETMLRTFDINLSWKPVKSVKKHSEDYELPQKLLNEMNEASHKETKMRTLLDEIDEEGNSLMQMIHLQLGRLYATKDGRKLITSASKGNSAMVKRMTRLEKERKVFETMKLDDNNQTTEDLEALQKVSVVEKFGDIIAEVSDEITMKYPFSIRFDLSDVLTRMVTNIVEGDIKCSLEHAQISVKLGLKNMISEVFEREQKQIDQRNRRLLLNLVGT